MISIEASSFRENDVWSWIDDYVKYENSFKPVKDKAMNKTVFG